MQRLKSKIKVSYFLAATLSLSGGALFAGGVSAQQAVLEEVLVTAEKREQTIQELPISIDAFDAESLETLQISGFEDISEHVVGLYGGPNSADVGGVKIYVRGIGTGDPQVGLDSRLALYVDGVYVGKTVGLAFDSVDLERVEVLKGPQGTLYGRNAVAGAINLISRKADPSEFDAKVSVTAGNYSAFKLKAHVNVPVADNLAVKFSAYASEVDGWVENKGDGNDFSGHEREGARLDVAFIPNDQMRFDYSYEYTDSENQPLFYQSVNEFATGRSAGLSYKDHLADPVDGKRQDDVNANFGQDVDVSEIETEAHTLLGRWDWSENHYAKLLFGYREVTASRYNIFWPEIKPGCINENDENANPDGVTAGSSDDPCITSMQFNAASRMLADGQRRSLHGFLTEVLLQPNRSGLALSGLLSGAVKPNDNTDMSDQRPTMQEFLHGFSMAGNSSAGGDSLMDPAESWSLELNQIGTLLDGRLEYTAGFYYFKEEIENSSAPYPYGALALLGGFGASLGIARSAQVRTGVATNVCRAIPGSTYNPLTQRDFTSGGCNDASGVLQQLNGVSSIAVIDQGVVQASVANARNGTNPVEWELNTEAWALFGQATWTPEGFDDRLHITVGARYSKDDKEGDLQPAFSFPHADQIPAWARSDGQAQAIPELSGDNDYDSFDPMVRGVWDLDENSIVYASVSRGFLSGGYNVALAGEGGFEFDKQNILAYEAGFKGDLMDRRLRVNAAVFYYEMDDDQNADTNPSDPTSRAIANIDTEFEGAELALTYVLNEELTVNLQYAYLDTETDPYISNYNAPGEYETDGDVTTAPLRSEVQRTATGAPENTINISVDYTTSLMQVLPWLGQEGEFHAHLGYSHSDEAFGSNRNPRDQYDLFNAEVGFSIPHENGVLKVSLWAQNMFDNEYIIDSLLPAVDKGIRLFKCSNPQGQSCGTAEFVRSEDVPIASLGAFGYGVVIYGDPRTFGLTVSYDYE